MYDGLNGSFRTIKLRERSLDCAVCGDTPTITGLIDYEQFCGSSPDDKVSERSHDRSHDTCNVL